MSTGQKSSCLPKSLYIDQDQIDVVVYRAATVTSELAVIDRELELVFPKASTNQLCQLSAHKQLTV